MSDKESEPLQFTFNGLLSSAFQGSRVSSDSSSRAGVGCGQSAEFKSAMSVQRLAPIMECRDARARAFIKDLRRHLGKVIEQVPRQSMESLKGYAWPGNVRDLRNVIGR